eukprot:1159059-Pelagomonas_calceolata.AAC.5
MPTKHLLFVHTMYIGKRSMCSHAHVVSPKCSRESPPHVSCSLRRAPYTAASGVSTARLWAQQHQRALQTSARLIQKVIPQGWYVGVQQGCGHTATSAGIAEFRAAGTAASAGVADFGYAVGLRMHKVCAALHANCIWQYRSLVQFGTRASASDIRVAMAAYAFQVERAQLVPVVCVRTRMCNVSACGMPLWHASLANSMNDTPYVSHFPCT